MMPERIMRRGPDRADSVSPQDLRQRHCSDRANGAEVVAEGLVEGGDLGLAQGRAPSRRAWSSATVAMSRARP
jgi:hypothetical protein